jgi:hypothetical protein
MPSRKQRRRRQKERRHEYEYVYVDDEGHELDPVEVEETKTAPRERKQASTTRSGRKQPSGRQPAGAARAVPPPSWRRVARRAAIFAPFMFVAIWLLGHNRLTTASIVLQTVWLMALFVPFSYVIDRMMYRRYVRQTGQPSSPPERQRRA